MSSNVSSMDKFCDSLGVAKLLTRIMSYVHSLTCYGSIYSFIWSLTEQFDITVASALVTICSY